MAEITITEDAIIFNHTVGIVRKERSPEDISDLYQQVLTYIPDLDLSEIEFSYFVLEAA